MLTALIFVFGPKYPLILDSTIIYVPSGVSIIPAIIFLLSWISFWYIIKSAIKKKMGKTIKTKSVNRFRKSEIITVILGGLGSIFLVTSLVFYVLRSCFLSCSISPYLLFFHFLVLLLALPYLAYTIKSESITRFFVWIIGMESVFNTILMLLWILVINSGDLVILGILELLPVFLVYLKRGKISRG
ncbi:MAG: hypothetical protein HeimC3_35680 [Candidatus Heimdallarchaeota archaeon LC_3]|nr:MAG: hypothetical protein HeimC3_35680 [Candidatus Heimdallarchaeota archaeon LC_3]